MSLFFTIIRVLAAILAPLITFTLAIRTAMFSNRDQPGVDSELKECLRCGQTQKGTDAKFYYTESVGSPRQRAARMQYKSDDTPILGEETHFICNHCARRYIRNELVQQILIVLPYPFYLYVYIPFIARNALPGNFLVETLLLVMSLAGATSAFDLFRSVHSGKNALTEARDRVAIKVRKDDLGKKFSYYTRSGNTALRK